MNEWMNDMASRSLKKTVVHSNMKIIFTWLFFNFDPDQDDFHFLIGSENNFIKKTQIVLKTSQHHIVGRQNIIHITKIYLFGLLYHLNGLLIVVECNENFNSVRRCLF